MKRIALMLVMVMAVTAAIGQKNVRQTASNYLRSNKLDKAMEAINQCINDATTSSDPKTWLLRGNIYMEIANTTNDAFKALEANPLQVALESYKKAMEFDTKGENYESIVDRLNAQRTVYFNAAVDHYNKSEYKGAMENFAKGADVIAIAKVSDTTSLLNAALCAELAKEPQLAKQYLNELIKGGYKSVNVYAKLSDLYRLDKDEENAFKVIQEGMQAFPNNMELFLAETNAYLTFGKTDKALANLKATIEKEKSNPSVFFALGTVYDQLSNDSTKTADFRQQCFENAVNAYKNALTLTPSYFDAAFNLGALYVNKAATINDEANKLPLDQADKFDQLKKQADGYLEMATPYLETASTLQPNDLSTLVSLKQIYARTGKADKLKEVNEKIAKITQ